MLFQLLSSSDRHYSVSCHLRVQATTLLRLRRLFQSVQRPGNHASDHRRNTAYNYSDIHLAPSHTQDQLENEPANRVFNMSLDISFEIY